MNTGVQIKSVSSKVVSAALAYKLVPEGGKINLGGSLEHAIKEIEGKKYSKYS